MAVAADLLRPRRLSRSLGRALVLSAALLGLLQPRAFVWCQTEAGHAALEALAAGCCGAAGPQARCFPEELGATSRGPGDENGVGSQACRDVLVDPPSSLRPGEKVFCPAAALEPFAAGAPVPPRPRPAASRGAGRVRPTAHDLVLATVLRV